MKSGKKKTENITIRHQESIAIKTEKQYQKRKGNII